MTNYYYDHKKITALKEWFENVENKFLPITQWSDFTDDTVLLNAGDILFAHVDGRMRNELLEKAIKQDQVDFVLMSRDINTLKREASWPQNIHLCRYPVHELSKHDRTKQFFVELSSGKRLWNLLIPDSTPNLIALAILCQGYIAAHAELSDTKIDIRRALERMGWDRVPPELQKKVKEKQKDVMEASWWQVFGDNAALWETIKSEWDEGWTEDGDVAQLVKMISSETAMDNTEAVVKAYLQLSSKLGK